MTRFQNRAIAIIARKALETAGADAEFKEWSVTELTQRLVSVVVSTGKVGDEGTLAESLCRYRAHFFVGQRGRIEVAGSKDIEQWPDSKRNQVRAARRHPLIYGWNL